MSLSTWFRDYLYIHLGGSKGTTWNKIRNVFIVFLVSGFWHGANWTFIAWGALNAVYFLPLLLTKNNRSHLNIVAEGKLLPSIRELGFMLVTFGLTVFAWIFFRAENMGHALQIISGILTNLGSFFLLSTYTGYETIGILLVLFLGIEWVGREQQFAIASFGLNWPRPLRYLFYYGILFLIFWYGDQEQQFIYFQF
jgi:D-alanyl-lipoteichoic acid acyltransferase DltB (MBOAT superfamily)